jgi:hypothetical protein
MRNLVRDRAASPLRKAPASRPAIVLCPPSSNLTSSSDASRIIAIAALPSVA